MMLSQIDAETYDDERGAHFRPEVNAGDTVLAMGVTPDYKILFTITDEALSCDCGKGLYCPLVIQDVQEIEVP